MPPPPPNFVPVNRRQRLDPTRYLKSRELWNQVRFHASASRHPPSNSSNPNARSPPSATGSRGAYALALARAVAYELQPFRIRPCLRRTRVFVLEEDGLRRASSSVLEFAKSILSLLKSLFQFLREQLQQTDADILKYSFLSKKSLLAKFAAVFLALRIYFRVLVYLHDLLHAGPIIIILTLLTLLYTVGLGDNTGAGSGVPSAYSVFNRGMRRILGTVDAEELAGQYAGGVMMAGVNNNNVRNDEFDDGGDIWFANDEVEEEEEQNLVNERRRQRRLERLQRQNNIDNVEGENDENDDGNPGEENVDRAPLPDNDNNEVEEDVEQDLADEAARPAATNGTTGTTNRHSRKKSRRQNLELRREMQRQRQAAAAMVFVGAGGENANDGGGLEARILLE